MLAHLGFMSLILRFHRLKQYILRNDLNDCYFEMSQEDKDIFAEFPKLLSFSSFK